MGEQAIKNGDHQIGCLGRAELPHVTRDSTNTHPSLQFLNQDVRAPGTR